MDAAGALGETLVFLDHFRSLPDPRQRGKVVYPLDEVLLLCLLAVLAGADSFVAIARYEIVEEEAQVVRLVFKWIGHDHLSSGEVSRRLHEAGYVTQGNRVKECVTTR